jgi:NTP pyrophosphatase (non-canonical NTP hydrolase)
MHLQEIQSVVDQWIKSSDKGYFPQLTNLGILMEEVGELSRILVRTYGEQRSKASDLHKNLADEMADILWVVVALANQCDIDLEEALRKNIEKKNLRDR